MLSTTELLKLMESQQDSTSVKTIDQHTQQTEHLADLESELVQVNRQLSTTRKNISHYQQMAAQMLRVSPERFGDEIIKLLQNIATAKVMKDHPDLFDELHQLEDRVEQIRKEVGR